MEPKTLLKIIFYGTIIILVLILYVPNIDLVVDHSYYEEEVMPPIENEYAIDSDTSTFIEKHLITDSFLAQERMDLKRAIFTTINSGTNNFTFYCAREYEDCYVDLKEITNDRRSLTYFNNFVHPYNNYHTIDVEYDSRGKIDLGVTRLYSNDEIEQLEEKVTELWEANVNEGMSKVDIIRTFHDKILNKADYDKERAEAIEEDYDLPPANSDKATGALLDEVAICGGYSDAMALFLYELGLKNYRISNEKHIWNYLKLDDEWLHLDLTWNNPSANGETIIISTYFLVDTAELESIEDGAHHYNKDIFIEAQ